LGSAKIPPAGRTALFETRYNSLSIIDNIYLTGRQGTDNS